MAKPIVFGGLGASLLLAVFLLSELLLAASAAGLVAALALHLLPSTARNLSGAVALVVIAAWVGRWMVGAFLRFGYVSVRPDGSWRLRNAWGIPLRTVVADESREIRMMTQRRFAMVGYARFYNAAWVEIHAHGRISCSLYGIPETIGPAYRELSTAAGRP